MVGLLELELAAAPATILESEVTERERRARGFRSGDFGHGRGCGRWSATCGHGCCPGSSRGALPEGVCCANAPPLAINGDAVVVRPLAVVAEQRERRGQGDSRAEAVVRSGGGSSRVVAALGRGGLVTVLLGACYASSAPLLLRHVLCGLGSRQAQASRWYGCDRRHGDGIGQAGAGGAVLNDGRRGEHPGSWSAWAGSRDVRGQGKSVRSWAGSRDVRGQGKKEKEERRREK